MSLDSSRTTVARSSSASQNLILAVVDLVEEMAASQRIEEMRALIPQVRRLAESLERACVRHDEPANPSGEFRSRSPLEELQQLGFVPMSKPAETRVAPTPQSLSPRPPNAPLRTVEEQLDLAFDSENADRQPSWRGRSNSIALSQVLELAAVEHRTGTLRVRTPEETLTFELMDGTIVLAASDNPPRGDCLGDLLMAMGFVDRATLDAYIEGTGPSIERVGEIATRAALVGAAELRQALEYQVQRRVYRAVGAKHAVFGLFEGDGAALDDGVRVEIAKLRFDSPVHSDNA